MTILKHHSKFTNIKKQSAMTLIELLIIIAILGVLSSLGNAWYTGYIETARINNAITQIAALSLLIKDYTIENGEPPTSLSQIDNSNLIDPWGRPYEYLKINLQDSGNSGGFGGGGGNPSENEEDDDDDEESPGNSAKGKARKNYNLVPLNTDFDLYSKGSDGHSQAPLSAPVSQDDVLRANNGGFIGLASTF